MAKIRETVVTNCEKNFLVKCLGEWTRLDGRAFDEFRPISIEFGKDWGCCSVSLGKTRVLAQTSCEVQQPKSSRPSEGVLYINIELNPIAAPHFEAGRQSDLAVELNRLLEKCVKDSKAVDLESLCIKTEEKVWALKVDLNVLNHEGNILDCASIALLASLMHFRRPDVTCDGEEFIIHSYQQRDPIPTVIHHHPICISYAIFNAGEFIVADPSLLEEGVSEAQLTIGLNAFRELCGLHLGGKVELMQDVILQTVSKASAKAISIINEIKEAVSADSEKRLKREPIGFHKNQPTPSGKLTGVDLEECLNQWMHKEPTEWMHEETTGKTKEEPEETEEVEETDGSDSDVECVEVLGQGSATLVKGGDVSNAWTISSDDADDDDVVLVE